MKLSIVAFVLRAWGYVRVVDAVEQLPESITQFHAHGIAYCDIGVDDNFIIIVYFSAVGTVFFLVVSMFLSVVKVNSIKLNLFLTRLSSQYTLRISNNSLFSHVNHLNKHYVLILIIPPHPSLLLNGLSFHV